MAYFHSRYRELYANPFFPIPVGVGGLKLSLAADRVADDPPDRLRCASMNWVLLHIRTLRITPLSGVDV